MSARPLIGISCRMDINSDRFYLRRQYSEAICHAGGTPLLIPLVPDKEFASSLTDELDGIVISGSNSDVNPRRYGQNPHRKLGTILNRRDRTDLLLLKGIFQKSKPLLAICFGIQVLNVHLGGTLWQDIPSQVGNAVIHDQVSSEEDRAHSILIKSGSLLYALAKRRKIKVNSYHHQALRYVSPRLVPVATSQDGLVEAVELRSRRQFLLGVQWHPEIGWEKDEISQNIFACFVESARSVGERRRIDG